MEIEDTKPWYRQFWPWFLICLPLSAVVASLYTVSLAVRTTDSLVITAEDGVDVVTERHLAAERRARELGLVATFDVDLENGAISLSMPGDTGAELPPTLELLLSHPTNSARDQSIALASAIPLSDGSKAWAGHFVAVPDGRWYVVLDNGDEWRLGGTWSGEASIRLEPAGAGHGR